MPVASGVGGGELLPIGFVEAEVGAGVLSALLIADPPLFEGKGRSATTRCRREESPVRRFPIRKWQVLYHFLYPCGKCRLGEIRA
jgi:hypothetical protein